MASPKPTRVYLEITEKKAFACSVDWPGWCRSGRTEAAALEALAAYARRYQVVAETAGKRFGPAKGERLEVVERVPGGASTAFGVPGAFPSVDEEPLTAATARRQVELLEAAWAVLDEVVKKAPEQLRKGPRGGGRDRDAMLQHVLGAEAGYARKLGVRHPEPPAGERPAVDALRAEVVAVLRAARAGEPLHEKGWTPRYAVRRIAWHALDHAWEMEDRAHA
jgi:hypothetical protein